MSFLIGLLTVVMVLNCLVLIFLVLIQLPKKDAGAGLAFGGGATDALFGAGSGNVLTKVTKWAAGIFFGLAILLSLLNAHARKERSTLAIPSNWQPPVKQSAASATPPPAAMPLASAPGTNNLLSAPVSATNAPAAVSSNAPAAK